MPWAISFYDFKVPKEKVNVTDAYNYFCAVNSGGTDNSDWYKDNQATGILTKFKIKKNKDLFFIYKFLLNTR
jgi:hypothetical protein